MEIRAAVVQDAPPGFDAAGSVERVLHWIARAAAESARIVVFPEAFVGPGYPKGMDFGARVGMRTPEGRDHYRRYFDAAVNVPGKETEAIATAAAAHRIWVVCGAIERAGSTLYCTVLFFSPDGALVAKHRKVMPTAMERLIWGFGDGSTLPVVDTGFGRAGAVICWENYMPLLRTAMYAQGIELYCAPTVDDRETWTPTMRHIAIEGRCFVLSACQFATRAHYPDWYPVAGDGSQVLIRGGSLIADPFGTLLAGPLHGESGLLTATINLDAITHGKFDLDVTGHYARPDLFSLQVQTTPQLAVKSSYSD